MNSTRVRIAPSPSGFLHIGTAKIALMNWLFARSTGGKFILRLEDTDAERTDEEFVQAMCDGFDWLGLDWDEGPSFGSREETGEYGPYRQSERVENHRRAGAKLLEEGKAYKCFCTKEELDVERERAREEKRPPRYNGRCRNLTPEEVSAKGDMRNVLRFRVPEGTTILHDLVQGEVRTENAEFDDFVILKPNGDPIFHLAVVVDDADMKITHVIRGDDHLTNTVRHIMLFEALGYPRPHFAHLPLVLDENGKKYSKRLHGANVLDWRDDGFLPEALINYVALLGWSSGDDQDLFTRDELTAAFTLERVGKSAAKFDLKRLQWLNGQHIRKLSVEELYKRILPRIHDAGLDTTSKSSEWLLQMTQICQEKLRTLNEIVEYVDFFFLTPETYVEKAVKKQWRKDGALERMRTIRTLIESVEPWSHETMKTAYETLAVSKDIGLGTLIHPTRLALTGKSVGPGLFELAELLGKEDCLTRMDKAIKYVTALD